MTEYRLSFTAKAISSRKERIYLVQGVDAGREAWYYVLVDALKLSLFLQALNTPRIELERYGKVLYSGYGKEPPSEITDQLMLQKY